jgi:hypothetical protein
MKSLQIVVIAFLLSLTFASAETLTIKGSNVGIGTSSPNANLQIGGNEELILLANPTNARYAVGIGTVHIPNTGNRMDFYTGDTGGNNQRHSASLTKMSILPNGNVGVGTINPRSALEINKQGQNNAEIRMTNTGNGYDVGIRTYHIAGAGQYLEFGSYNPTTYTPTMWIEPNGNVHVGKNLYVKELPAGQSTSICVSGFVPNNGYLFGSCSSSEKFKKNIQNLNLGLETIGKLRPVSFNWKASGEADVGLIAEEVQKVNPELVTYDKDGKLIGVKYDQISAVLIKGMQEQQKQIEQLKKEIAELKK